MTEVEGTTTTARLPNDAFPTFSDGEMANRMARVRAEMAERNIDALLVHGHTGIGNSVGQVNVQYLARYAAVVETFLVVPREEEPTLLLAVPFHIPNARDIAYVQDIRWGDALGNALGRLREVGAADGRIGVVGPGTVSHIGPSLFHEQWIRLAGELPGATLEVATAWFDDLRLVKSDEEIALLRAAGRWTDRAHEEVFTRTREGVTPRELRRALDTLAARAGLTYPFGHIGATSMAEPTGYYPDFYPVDQPIADGSIVMTELALGFGNHFGKLWGSYFVGEPTDVYRHLFEVAAEVHSRLVAELRPGMTGRDVEAFLQPIRDAGFEQPANVLVGGWSAMNHPPQMGAMETSLSAPFAAPYLDVALEPRQAVTVQAWVNVPGTNTGLWIGSSGVVTDTGFESWNQYPIDTIRVAGDDAPAPLIFHPVRGRVVHLDDEQVRIEQADGSTSTHRLHRDWTVQVTHPLTLADLEPGRFVGAIEHPGGGEVGRAVELHVYLPGITMGYGNQPWDRPFGSRMVQGDLVEAIEVDDGIELVLAIGDGEERRLTAPADVPISLIANEGREHIRPGVDVFTLDWPQPDGAREVNAIATHHDSSLPLL